MILNRAELYNIGTGQGVSVKEFVEACKKVCGVDIKVSLTVNCYFEEKEFLRELCYNCGQVVEQADGRPGDYAEVYADPSRINHQLGWRAQYTDVQDGLRHAWSWRQKHQSGYG